MAIPSTVQCSLTPSYHLAHHFTHPILPPCPSFYSPHPTTLPIILTPSYYLAIILLRGNTAMQCIYSLLRRPSKTAQPLVRADCPKPPNPSYAQTVQNRPVNSQFMGLSFTEITSFFYINQPAQTADLSSM